MSLHRKYRSDVTSAVAKQHMSAFLQVVVPLLLSTLQPTKGG